MTYRISFWSNIKELRYKVGKLIENYEEKMGITSLWPWPLTQGHQIQYGPSQCSKQPFSENRVQIDASVRLEFCSQEVPDTQTDRQTDRHTHTHTHTDTQTNWSENITPPRFRGGVINKYQWTKKAFLKEPFRISMFYCMTIDEDYYQQK